LYSTFHLQEEDLERDFSTLRFDSLILDLNCLELLDLDLFIPFPLDLSLFFDLDLDLDLRLFLDIERLIRDLDLLDLLTDLDLDFLLDLGVLDFLRLSLETERFLFDLDLLRDLDLRLDLDLLLEIDLFLDLDLLVDLDLLRDFERFLDLDPFFGELLRDLDLLREMGVLGDTDLMRFFDFDRDLDLTLDSTYVSDLEPGWPILVLEMDLLLDSDFLSFLEHDTDLLEDFNLEGGVDLCKSLDFDLDFLFERDAARLMLFEPCFKTSCSEEDPVLEDDSDLVFLDNLTWDLSLIEDFPLVEGEAFWLFKLYLLFEFLLDLLTLDFSSSGFMVSFDWERDEERLADELESSRPNFEEPTFTVSSGYLERELLWSFWSQRFSLAL